LLSRVWYPPNPHPRVHGVHPVHHHEQFTQGELVQANWVDPGQSSPPLAGAGLVQFRDRTPFPQSGSQALQPVHTPSTEVQGIEQLVLEGPEQGFPPAEGGGLSQALVCTPLAVAVKLEAQLALHWV